MKATLPTASRTVLSLDNVTSLRIIRAVRGDGPGTTAGVLAGPDHDQQLISAANALAARLGIRPAGHWRKTGEYDLPEFYPAETDTGLTWLKFLVSLGIDPEDESAIEVMFDA